MLWEVDIYPAGGERDAAAERLVAEAAELGMADGLSVTVARGYLIEGSLDASQLDRLGRELLADVVVERFVAAPLGDLALLKPPPGRPRLIHVLPKPGVMDPVAQSTLAAIADLGFTAEAVRTLRKYWLSELPEDHLRQVCGKLLANDAIEQVVIGPLRFTKLEIGAPYQFRLIRVPLAGLDAKVLAQLSRDGQLFLSAAEMQAIQAHFAAEGREPTDAELETIAQTWSEHCSHKTLRGTIRYRDENGERVFDNLLRETVFAATDEIRRRLGPDDWCVSVFQDNAGVVRFNDRFHLAFKVETHNHPSALEPYGGANTGLGGVIRDTLGTGLGAKPVASTDVFCFAPPDLPWEQVPPGALHPKRVLQGVVAGVRDYGNRMGIPTVNGAVYFDQRYVANPLVYCGNVGLLPVDKVRKEPRAGDLIVVMGGRTGRDGIHGATFSSAELTTESESISGGAVQIGNAITEKMLVDSILMARDRNLYTAITDCGAGGLSSAVGEMGANIGAEVWLDRVPLKYSGLSYTEIWISEAQERMVLSVPPDNWPALSRMAAAEGVEATVIGKFVPTGRLVLKFEEQVVADLAMGFLHNGRPRIIRDAVYRPPHAAPLVLDSSRLGSQMDVLLRILGSPNVASKEWIIRQYDHEVQGGSVVKPLVGAANDGPSDAAVLRPDLSSRRAIVLACGMNALYGDLDTFHMAASAIDEAVRNCVAVGADPSRIALLDNFCWGNTDNPETLGSLVRAAIACRDVAVALGTPFISGKDSLNNEYRFEAPDGSRQTLAIPASLLISALGQMDDVDFSVTMDLKRPGNSLYLIGLTKDELGGSHYARVRSLAGGQVPLVDPPAAARTFAALHDAIQRRLIRACHDLSEGGLALAAAEMSLGGGFGATIYLDRVPVSANVELETAVLLFSESNSRFLCEVAEENGQTFEEVMSGVPHAKVGEVDNTPRLRIFADRSERPKEDRLVIDGNVATLKEAWQSTLRF